MKLLFMHENTEKSGFCFLWMNKLMTKVLGFCESYLCNFGYRLCFILCKIFSFSFFSELIVNELFSCFFLCVFFL